MIIIMIIVIDTIIIIITIIVIIIVIIIIIIIIIGFIYTWLMKTIPIKLLKIKNKKTYSPEYHWC